MLRHLKMEFKRQQQQQGQLEQLAVGQAQQSSNQQASAVIPNGGGAHLPATPALATSIQLQTGAPAAKPVSTAASAAPKRVRGRRSSKPAMEKRRRARINECLDILKNYVLTDSTNLSCLGIDTNQRENHDEETIARMILKSSGLIYRHKGRKNPNKLEKADILELTVDYVRRLHEQRDKWIAVSGLTSMSATQSPLTTAEQQAAQSNMSLTVPLKLHLPSGAQARTTAIPPSPPNSSASSSPKPLLSLSHSTNVELRPSLALAPTPATSPEIAVNNVLDLSDSRRVRASM